jgi:glycosyltransferase involved in cell wall biosynthesis
MSLRILHLLASPVFSGPAENVLELALAQRALGHQVTVAVERKRRGLNSEEPAVPRFEAHGILDGEDLELSTHSSPPAMLHDAVRLRRREVEVVHAHFSHDHWLAFLGRPRGAVLVRSIHAPRSLRWSTPRADGFTVPVPELLERVRGHPARVLRPIVPGRFRPPEDVAQLRVELGLHGSPLVGMVSTFQPSRRHELGLRTFAELRAIKPEARLLLLGDGLLESQLRILARELGIEGAVLFCGYQAQDDFVRRLQALDEVWLLGLGNDWSGRAAAQARACGVRVVALSQGGLASLADATVNEATPRAILQASLAGNRSQRFLPAPDAVASEILALYQEAEARQ